MPEGLFVDMRRFAVPPGRVQGGERFERRPPRRWARAAVRRWAERWWGTEGDPSAVAAYVPNVQERSTGPRRRV